MASHIFAVFDAVKFPLPLLIRAIRSLLIITESVPTPAL
jgi:hypothetical protein